MIKNNWNEQKSLNSYVWNFQEKCMKHVIKLKKKEYRGLTNAWGQKPWRNLRKKTKKKKKENHLDWIGRREKVRKSLKKLLNMWRTREERLFIKLNFRNSIGRDWSSIDLKNRFDWLKTNRAQIKLGRVKPNF